jgi:hypothetical protein
MENKRKFAIIFAFCMIVAFALRIGYINTNFWYDEACSWFSAKQAFPFGIMDNLLNLDLQHTPLYFFLLHLWIKLFGDSEIAIRSLSFVFSLATIPATYIVTKKLLDKPKSLIITGLISVSPILVFFSTEARMYPMVIFLTLISVNNLINFEQNGQKKDLVKLVISNLLIPYTFVGGIFYNISLAICYGRYLFKTNKDKFNIYIKACGIEFICLIPFFCLIGYYARMRSIFVVRHEGVFAFWQFIEVIRNFFGATIVPNPYWPTMNAYSITFLFSLLVIIPCVYFIYGYIQGFKHSDEFFKVFYNLTLLSLGLALISSFCQINIFTVRYVIYLLPLFFITSINGLSKSLSFKHLIIFCCAFICASTIFDIRQTSTNKNLKTMAFADVKRISDKLNLTNEDIIIMPFGSDAPYYFRKINTPRVYNFDFHKETRNPYNNRYYDKNQQNQKSKFEIIYNSIYEDKCFSDNFVNDFISKVNQTTPSGRYALIALYGQDRESLVDINELRNEIKNLKKTKVAQVQLLMDKYMYDVRYLLSLDFNLVQTFEEGNYMYLLYIKK